MGDTSELLADIVSSIDDEVNKVDVILSNELVQLLSEQLYHSPFKAIEELVVNAYDANAAECRVFVPLPSDQDHRFIVVFDDGIGMDYPGLVNLWQIGRSNKRDSDVEKRAKRKQIGKFGIGKLATYTIAHKVTYITRTGMEILSVTLDFNAFSNTQPGKAVQLSVKRISDWGDFAEGSSFQSICAAAFIDIESLFKSKSSSWTISVLEKLKGKAETIASGRLKWILSTAMPLQNDFHLFLNGEPISRTKESFDPIAEFGIADLPQERIKNLHESTGEEWKVKGKCLVSKSFPRGISGTILVTRQSLLGKSSDLERSHGFFVRARGRLLNEADPYFGTTKSSYGTFVRLRADLQADDLDAVITAPREGVEDSSLREKFVKVLDEVLYEARQIHEKAEKKAASGEDSKHESDRSFVDPHLVEHPIADALTAHGIDQQGSEADESWFYLRVSPKADVKKLIDMLYNEPRRKYSFTYTGRGPSARIAQFSPETSSFIINSDHEFVRAHDDGRAKVLLEDVVTAEVLLEVYLREYQVPPHTIGEVLERRDALLRSLARDHPFSLKAIAGALRDAATNKYDLEIAIVAAVRALGFVATHIGGAHEPDGLARFSDYPTGQKKITLEAKSSGDVPSLSHLDFAALDEHVQLKKAQGCLLVAPAYPGSTKEDNAAANRAQRLKISCWTIEQLAKVVEVAESRHVTAQQVLDIVLICFSPDQVTRGIERLFEKPTWEIRHLYRGILEAFRSLDNRLKDTPRSVTLVAGEVSARPEFSGIEYKDVEKAVQELVSASQGLLTLSNSGNILIHGSYEEIERRLSGLTGQSGAPRRPSTFRDGFTPTEQPN